MEPDENLKYTDFKIVSKDGEIHPCYKHVLDKNSPVLKAMLQMDCVETKNGVMEVQDYSAETVRNFLKYMNANEAGSDIVELAKKAAKPGEHIFKRQFRKDGYTTDLLSMAHYYQVEDLQADCIAHLSQTISKENVVECWIVANRIDCVTLKTAALDFLAKHFHMGDTKSFPGLYHSDKTFQLMEDLHQYMFSCKQNNQQAQEQNAQAREYILSDFGMQKLQDLFLKACGNGNLKLVNWMMDMPGKLVQDLGLQQRINNSLFTLGFWYACHNGHLNIVNHLLKDPQNDIEVNAELESSDMIYLEQIEGDHEINWRRGMRVTALQQAVSMKHYDVVKRLLELDPAQKIYPDFHYRKLSNFMAACSEADLKTVNFLLQLPKGSINIKERSDEGENGFMLACGSDIIGHFAASVVKRLLELPRGSFNIDETNNDGETGLDIAVREGNNEIAAAIRQYKQDMG